MPKSATNVEVQNPYPIEKNMRLNTESDVKQFLDNCLHEFRWFVEKTQVYPLNHAIAFTDQISGHSDSICKTDAGYQFVHDSDVYSDLRVVVTAVVMEEFWRLNRAKSVFPDIEMQLQTT